MWVKCVAGFQRGFRLQSTYSKYFAHFKQKKKEVIYWNLWLLHELWLILYSNKMLFINIKFSCQNIMFLNEINQDDTPIY